MVIQGITSVVQNAITPGRFIHIVTGQYEKHILPQLRFSKEWRKYPPTQKQIDFLHKHGVLHTRGLTRMQASVLISIIIERDRLGLAEPWMLEIITRDTKMPMDELHKRYSSITKHEAWQIIRNI